MKLIVGLGNPGPQYDATRHNIGFEVVEFISRKWGIPLTQSKFNGLYGTGTVKGEKVVLLRPLTYMNLSGESISAFARFYKLDLQDIVVIYDDLDLPKGKIRLRQRGSAGGHNGIKSSIMHLGGEEFNRIRMGIGRPEGRMAVTDYVLGRFSAEEQDIMIPAVIKAKEACESWLQTPFIKVMNTYNVK